MSKTLVLCRCRRMTAVPVGLGPELLLNVADREADDGLYAAEHAAGGSRPASVQAALRGLQRHRAPGDGINITLAELEVIYSQERPDWRGALQYVKGVYVINDRGSGKSYVGSAYGDTGVWARWGQYVQTRHRGNVDLRALVERKGDAYARSNLAFSLLQSWPMATPESVIFARRILERRAALPPVRPQPQLTAHLRAGAL